jgi:hypothetical protein
MSLRHKTAGSSEPNEDVETPTTPIVPLPEDKKETTPSATVNPIGEYLDAVQDPAKRTKLARKVRRSVIENKTIVRIIGIIALVLAFAFILYLFGLIGPRSYRPDCTSFFNNFF